MFYLAKGNYEIYVRSLRLSIFGNIFFILSQMTLILDYLGINNYRITNSLSVIFFSMGATSFYWRNLRLKVKLFKLDPLHFQPTGNKIEHKGYFIDILWKTLSIYFLLQMILLVEIWASNRPIFFQGALFISYALMNVVVLYQVRCAIGKDRIKLRIELLQSFIFGFITGVLVIIDNAFMISQEDSFYSTPLWYICLAYPLLILLNVHNGILAAYKRVKLEHSIRNNFDSFSIVMTNQILYKVIYTNQVIQRKNCQ